MSAITRIGATGAGALLALGLFAAAPAGASDDHESTRADHEHRSARVTCLVADGQTQGRSASDPDGMSNGGPDKPGCTGGFDADRDWNNGCGNDADREDDNNGWCGRNPDRANSLSDKDDVDSDADRDAGDDEAPSTTTTTAVKAAEPETEEPAAAEDAESDDEATDSSDADTPADSDAEKPDDSTDEDSSPVTTAGAGITILAILGGITRLFLRIG